MVIFRAVGMAIEPPKQGAVGSGLVVTVNFYQIDRGRPELLESKVLTATGKLDLKNQVAVLLATMKARYEHAKNTADIVGQVIAEVNA